MYDREAWVGHWQVKDTPVVFAIRQLVFHNYFSVHFIRIKWKCSAFRHEVEKILNF